MVRATAQEEERVSSIFSAKARLSKMNPGQTAFPRSQEASTLFKKQVIAALQNGEVLRFEPAWATTLLNTEELCLGKGPDYFHEKPA